MAARAPLEGVLVVEVANWIAGPSCGALLADLGASVIKVEAPAGDSMRYVLRSPKTHTKTKLGDLIDVPFQVDNRGKRSICVALDTAEGQRVVRELAARADVFTTNLLPVRLERFNLGIATLMADNPGLVVASLSGWGLAGPDVDTMAFDTSAYFARGGVNGAMGLAAHGIKPRAGQGDHQTGLALCAAVLAALLRKARTGTGGLVEASLVRTATWNLATDVSAALVDGWQAPWAESHPLMKAYRCSDGRYVQVAMPFSEDKYWPRFCRAIDRVAWAAPDHPYGTATGRNRQKEEIMAAAQTVFAEQPLAAWRARLDGSGCISAPVQTLAEVCRDPQLVANGAFATVHHPVAGAVQTVAAPFNLHGAGVGPRGPAPEPGEHTDAVLSGVLGYSSRQIAALRAGGAVGFRPVPGTPIARWTAKTKAKL